MAADGVEEGFARNFLFALEIGDDEMIGSFFDALDFFIEAKSHAAVAEVIAKGFHHFGIGEFEKAGALFNEGDADAESGEHAGVLDADDAAPDDEHGFGNFGDAEDLITVDDGGAVERDERRFGGLGAGGNDNVLRFKFVLAAGTYDLDAMGVEKAGRAGNDIDAVAGELPLDDVNFGLDDVGGA